MQIQNESNSQISWWAYNTTDTSHLVHRGDDAGTIQAMSEISHDMGTDQVQLQINDNIYSGPFANAGTVVINTNAQPIAITGDLETWLTLFYPPALKGPTAPKQAAVVYITAGAATKMAFDAVVGLMGFMGPAAIIEKVGISLLGNVVSALLGTGAAPTQAPPTIDDIKAAVRAIIQEQDAQIITSQVIVQRRWLDNQLLVGAQLQAQGSDFTSDEISDFDDELDDLLGPNSTLLEVLERCRANESTRRVAMQAYALGLALFAQLRNISLFLTQGKRPLVASEFDQFKTELQAHLDVLTPYATQFELALDTAISNFNLVGTATGRALAQNIYRRYVGEDGVEPSQFVHQQVNSLQNVIAAIDQAKARVIPAIPAVPA